MHRVDVLVSDGVDELTALAPWHVLRTAVELGAPLTVRLAHLPGAPRTRSRNGLRLRPDGPLGPPADVLVVPGAGANPPVRADPPPLSSGPSRVVPSSRPYARADCCWRPRVC
jgi:putative intracellular protease/amidase